MLDFDESIVILCEEHYVRRHFKLNYRPMINTTWDE